jgi:hypothetical protein
MSVTKEDLREQNEKLAKVVRQLDEENSQLLDQARANLEKRTVEAAREVAQRAEMVRAAANLAERASEEAKTAAAAVSVRGGLLGLVLVSTALFVALNGHVTETQLLVGSWLIYLLYEGVMWFFSR